MPGSKFDIVSRILGYRHKIVCVYLKHNESNISKKNVDFFITKTTLKLKILTFFLSSFGAAFVELNSKAIE